MTEEDCLIRVPGENSAAQYLQPLAGLLMAAQIQQVSPAALAYIGDAVYELYIRTNYLLPPKKSHLYHQLVVEQVRAETQALHLASLTPHLNATELDIVRRGRNIAHKHSRRVNPEIYQQATSLETLVGYLYLTDFPRLSQLLAKLSLVAEAEK
ncbi:Mini-ribonuclease 3 [Aliterella atlantica]|uniref:Mini-ribonuclease 3 n=1 Tax=Aliterella atlantica CENA595 TaxID=1618023 RepID=A0A0D8ZY76_9CYAN|nr:ribonuclease III domain-containing protein [Aliterella atlantica]KJH73414.1 hypothetical protein UH38_01155 [Aliterella atlantica CENA595]